MKDSMFEMIGFQFKRVLPLFCSILILLAAHIPYHFNIAKYLIPDLGILCVYYWSTHRRDLFGVWSAFIFGLIADSLSTVPIGLNILTYLFVYVLANTFQNYISTRSFATGWGGLLLITLAAFSIKWLLASVYYSTFLPLSGIILSYCTTILLYPFIAWLNFMVQNKFLNNEEVLYEQGQ